jgi:hypothetical protein
VFPCFSCSHHDLEISFNLNDYFSFTRTTLDSVTVKIFEGLVTKVNLNQIQNTETKTYFLRPQSTLLHPIPTIVEEFISSNLIPIFNVFQTLFYEKCERIYIFFLLSRTVHQKSIFNILKHTQKKRDFFMQTSFYHVSIFPLDKITK